MDGAATSGQLRDIIFNTTTEENCPADVGVTGHPGAEGPRGQPPSHHAAGQVADHPGVVARTGHAQPDLVRLRLAVTSTRPTSRTTPSTSTRPTGSSTMQATRTPTATASAILADQDCDDLTFRLRFPMTATPRRARRSSSGAWTQSVSVQIQLRARCAHRPVLPDLRLRRHHLELVHRHRRRRAPRRGDMRRDRDRVQRGIATPITTASSQSIELDEATRIEQDPRAPADADRRRGLHRPVLLHDPGMADGHVHRLDRGKPRRSGSRIPAS